MISLDPNTANLMERVNIVSDRKKQVYSFSLLTIVIVVALGVGAVKPSIETIMRLNGEIKEKKVTLETLDTKINTLNSLSLQYSDFEETAQDLKLVFPTNGDFSLFLANIENICRTYGFQLNTIGFGRSRFKAEVLNLQNLKPVDVTLTVLGDKNDMIQLLQAFEEMPMYPIVRSVNFSNETSNEGLTNISISLVIYEIENETFYE